MISKRTQVCLFYASGEVCAKDYAGMKDKNGDLDEIMGIVGSLVAF